MTSDIISITANGTTISGWLAERITLSMEHVPNSFDITLTSALGNIPKVQIKPGDACVIKIGTDTVITGYVDALESSITTQDHKLQVTGRGRVADLVDCAAILQNQLIAASTLTSLINQLGKLFAKTGITCKPLSGDGPQIPPIMINWGETPWDIISKNAQFAGLLIYEDQTGNLVTSKIGTTKHASGVAQGVNMETATVSYDLAQRFSVYLGAFMSTDTLAEFQPGGNLQIKVPDPTFPADRYRPHIIVSPVTQASTGIPLATVLAKWEMARRRGRSQVVHVTLDSWRDSAGKLWQPNNLVNLQLPSLYLGNVDWIIAEVTLSKDESGTHAHLTCMPPDAFLVQPSSLYTLDADYEKAIAGSTYPTTPPASSP